MQLHNRAGSFVTVKNRTTTDSNDKTTSTQNTAGIKCFPCGRIDVAGQGVGADSWVNNTLEGATNPGIMTQVIPGGTATSNWPGVQNAILRRTPDPGANTDTLKRLPVILFDAAELHVELDGIFWCSAAGGPNDPEAQPEDTYTDPNTSIVYTLFPMGWNVDSWNYIAMEQK